MSFFTVYDNILRVLGLRNVPIQLLWVGFFSVLDLHFLYPDPDLDPA